MNAKVILRWALLAVVAGSLAIFALREPADGDADRAAATPPANTEAAKVVVTYFTTDVRCDSCRTIEALTRRAIEEGFAAELASGDVAFRVLNTDRAENEHFLEHYEIANKTVIVSRQHDGAEAEWTNRQDVWLLFEQPEEFFQYVREPVARYLAKS